MSDKSNTNPDSDSDSETIFCGLFQLEPWSQNQLGNSFDTRDHKILFINKNSDNKITFVSDPFTFSCYSYTLGKGLVLLRKISYDGKIAIVMTYKEDKNGRTLLNGNVYANDKYYEIIKFKIFNKLEVNNTIYHSIATCIFNL